MSTLPELRQTLSLALAMLEREAIIDFNGHFSARLPGGRGLLINAADSVRSRITESDFIEFGIIGAGKFGEGQGEFVLARFFELFRAGAALCLAVVLFEAADLRDPRRLRADVTLRAAPRLVEARFRAPARDADFLAPLFRALFFRAEVVRLREPLLLFLPPVEPPRDDFLAAAMI